MTLEIPRLVSDKLDEMRYLPMGKGIRAMLTRKDRFPNEATAMLAGAAMVPETRDAIETRLDQYWAPADLLPTYATEVIIGAGLHAAVYAAARVAAGYPKPTVLEASERVGGTFAMSRKPAFYLNSINRPGLVGGSLSNRGSLNYLPGSVLQPADISMGKYQTNSDIGFLVRLMLASAANVYYRANVDDVIANYETTLTTTRGDSIRCARLIDARGIGQRVIDPEPDGVNLLSYEQLMKRADSMFPLDGMRRVAVIGGGDSGKTAVEFLLGMAPQAGMSSATLDYIPQVDWYAPNIPQRKKDYRKTIRVRYSQLADYLPETYGSQETTRLTVYPNRGRVTKSIDSLLVNQLTYDTVIMATPANLPELPGMSSYNFEAYRPDRENSIASKYVSTGDIYKIGPAAELDWDSNEYGRRYTANPNNKDSIFRTAPRTASLATILN